MHQEFMELPFDSRPLLPPTLKTIPFLGNPASMVTIINYLVHALAADMGASLKNHQEKLEQAYLENDILFNCQLLETEQQKQNLDKKP